MNTPNDIEVLFFYYTRPGDHPRFHAPAVRETIKRYIDDGIFQYVDFTGEASEVKIKVTPKGKAWIAMLLNTPYPESCFVDPRTGKTIHNNKGFILSEK